LLLTVAVAVTLAGGSLVGIGAFGAERLTKLLPTGTAGDPGPAPSATGPDPELARQARVRQEKALTGALDDFAETAPEFSVAVLDHRTGQRYAYRGKEKYETASVVKVDILAALLLDAQDDDRSLTGTERSLADRMIRASDNDAATALFNQVGGSSGLTAANRTLGLSGTVTNAAWGLTRTTVNDQATLLAELADERGPLAAASRRFALDLMRTVNADQRWGVSAAATANERVAIKNGWLSRSTEGGRWIVNSLGRVTGDDVDVSVIVLSHGHGTQPDGIEAVERVAKLTRQHLKW